MSSLETVGITNLSAGSPSCIISVKESLSSVLNVFKWHKMESLQKVPGSQQNSSLS